MDQLLLLLLHLIKGCWFLCQQSYLILIFHKNFESERQVIKLKENKSWTRKDLVDLVHRVVPNFDHKDTGKFLDEKM